MKYLILIVAAFISGTQAASNFSLNVCWREAYSRGSGSVPNYCGEGGELSGPLCFPNCQANYTGVGPLCLENCPEGFVDLGAVCTVPSEVQLPCPWYDICGLAVAKGCLNCTEQGFHLEGCTCRRPGQSVTKKTYSREVSGVPQCQPGSSGFSGLCFNDCQPNFFELGPVCWANNSGNATSYVDQCNPFAFGQSEQDCDLLNAYLEQAGLTTPLCLGSLAFSVITGHVCGPATCQHLIKNVLPALENTPVCGQQSKH